jgi:putative flippase GtrA
MLFLLTGGLAALVNFGSRIIYSQWLSYSAAIVVAYVTGMVTAFVLARRFVFTETTRPVRQSAMYFILINILAVLQTWLVSIALAWYLLPAAGITRFVPELAHAAGVMVPVFTSYLGHKNLSFR